MSFRKLLAHLVRDEHETHIGKTGELTFYAGEIFQHDGSTPGGVLISAGSGGGGGPVTWASIINKPSFATVATSGSYTDLTNKPALFSGDYNDLTNKPALFSGAYADLTGKPSLFSGDYNDLANRPTIPDSILDLGVTDGTNGQVLTTDGAGNFTFTTVATGSLNARDVTRVYAYVTNADSVTIQKGQPVYMFAATGNRVSVKLAANTGDGTSAKTLGLADQAIAPGNPGYICTQGVVENINTAAYAEGDVLYLGATAGTLTNVKPHAPNHLVYIGVVERANAGNGLIYVRPQNGYELEELHNVNLIDTPPVTGDVLTYDGVQNLWVASAPIDLAAVGENIIPDADNTRDLGSPTKQWRHVYTAGGSIYLDNIKLTNNNGKLEAKKVINPGQVNEQEDSDDSDAFSEVRTISYNDLADKPAIPSDISDLTDNNSLLGGGNASTGNIVFEGDVLTNPDNETISIETFNGSEPSAKVVAGQNGVVGLKAYAHDSEYFNNSNWTTAQWYRGEGGYITFNFSSATNLFNFFQNTLNNSVENVKFTFEGSEGTVDYSGWSGNSNQITIWTGSQMPAEENDGANVSWIEFNFDIRSQVLIDYDEGDLVIDANDMDLRMSSTQDILLDSDDDIRLVARDEITLRTTSENGEVEITTRNGSGDQKTWTFNPDGTLQTPGFKLPATDGTEGQVLSTDGDGIVTWVDSGSSNGPVASITFADGTIQTTAYQTSQQYGYFTALNFNSNEELDMSAVTMDGEGNSYVSYSYYDENDDVRRGGIVKFNSAGVKQWATNLTSQTSGAEYPRIKSLEFFTPPEGNGYVVAAGHYYNNDTDRNVAFMYLVDAVTGQAGSMFDVETSVDNGMEVQDSVFGLDGDSNPFSVMVGQTYDETLDKTFTPLAGSTVDKLYLSWAEVNASGVQPGEQINYNVGGSYYLTVNNTYAQATPDGTGNGITFEISTTEAGSYVIRRASGWSGVVYGWTDPITLTILGTNLGGASPANDLTFTLNTAAFLNDSWNLDAAISNVSGTPIADVYCQGFNGKDWSTEIGNTLTMEYRLNNQAYIQRLGANPWLKNIGSAGWDKLYSVAVDSSENSYVAGNIWNGSKGSVVIKYDVTGSQQWAVYIDSADNNGNDIVSIDITSDGLALFTVDEDGLVTKLSTADGSILWQVDIDSDPSWDSDFRGTATPANDYIVTANEDDDYTLYVICLNGNDGTVKWAKRISRSNNGNDGEITVQDDFECQNIDCNATHVTIAGNTYLNGGSPNNSGLVINFPISGEDSDGTYGQYTISSVELNNTTESTGSVVASVATVPSLVFNSSPTINSTSGNFTANRTTIGGDAGETVTTGDITFEGSTLRSPNGTSPWWNGVITLAPGSTTESNYAEYGQFINIYPTWATDQPHIHIAAGTGNSSTGDLILGDDNYHVDINHNGSIYIKTNSQSNTWQFGENGTLYAPGQVEGTRAYFNDVIVNNAAAFKMLYTNGGREIYDTNFGYDPDTGAMSGTGNITTTGNITAANLLYRQVAVPTSSKGTAGNLLGDIAFGSGYVYYCTANYTDGVADIWKRVAFSADTW